VKTSSALSLGVVLLLSFVANASAYRAPTATETTGIEHGLESSDLVSVSEIHVADQGGWATAIVVETGAEGEAPSTFKTILDGGSPGEWQVAKMQEVANPLGFCIGPGSELERIEMPGVIAHDLGYQRCSTLREPRIFVMYQPFFDDAVAYQPKTLVLEALGFFKMKDVRWTAWGATTATGTATAWRMVCPRGSCSRPRTTSARLVLSDPVQCKEKHRYISEGPRVFSRLSWRLAAPLPGGIARRDSISMLAGPGTGEPCR
jgi:hypothetical protein